MARWMKGLLGGAVIAVATLVAMAASPSAAACSEAECAVNESLALDYDCDCKEQSWNDEWALHVYDNDPGGGHYIFLNFATEEDCWCEAAAAWGCD